MPRIPEPQPSPFAVAASAAIRRLKADHRVSNADIAMGTGLSTNYIAERLRDEKSFTLSDIEEIANFFELGPTDLLLNAAQATSNVTQLRPKNVGGYADDLPHGIDTAAGTDETQADED